VDDQRAGGAPRTLSFDIGGTRLKAALLDGKGDVLEGPVRTDTPKPAGPDKVVPLLIGLARQVSTFDRISVGFPGVVRSGVVLTAPNLGTPAWRNTRLVDILISELGKPARLLNDGNVQGLGVIAGSGVEVCITLGTGMGFALFREGRLAPHLEMGQHPVRTDRTYDKYIGNAVLQKIGPKRWNKRVGRVITYLSVLTNYDTLYIGGGNAKAVRIALPDNVRLVANQAGLTGGVKLWDMLPEEDFVA
jgi:polyphosphate glucokinase